VLRVHRLARAESDKLETMNSGDKQRSRIGYLVEEGLAMLEATFAALMLFAFR
jgi:hypothetical protein